MTLPSLFPPDSPGVKICGVTQGDQADEIVEAGADGIGVNLWPRSKRYIRLEEACSWLKNLAGETVRVAVFVNPSEDELQAVADSGLIDQLQLHGDETPDLVESLLEKGLPVFKALGVKDRSALQVAGEYSCSTILLDAYAPVEYGGSGELLDWALGAEAVEQFPEKKIILAGGLTPENVRSAIEQVGPAAVDVATGVEIDPGIKDLDSVRRFIAAVRAAD